MPVPGGSTPERRAPGKQTLLTMASGTLTCRKTVDAKLRIKVMNQDGKAVAGIVLAAGSGSRMGRTKQLLPFGQTTLLGQVIDTARHSDLAEIVVVLGHDAQRIQALVDLSGTRTIINPEYATGQASSLKAGVGAVSMACQGAMFLLGDQPLVSVAVINRLIQAFENGDQPLVVPVCHGRRGNPVIVARSLFQRLESLSGDTGARVLFQELDPWILKVDIKDGAIRVDVDTPEDYTRLTAGKTQDPEQR